MEVLPDTEVLVIRGKDRDVKKVVELIEQIEEISDTHKRANE